MLLLLKSDAELFSMLRACQSPSELKGILAELRLRAAERFRMMERKAEAPAESHGVEAPPRRLQGFGGPGL
jgi:hypothetical protein